MPTLGLTMIVKDVEASIEPCLASIANHVDEIVIVDTGSSDRTKEIIGKVAPRAQICDFTPETHPDAFLLDVPESWPNETLTGPFSGKPFLAHFGMARQFGWEKLRSDYRMWIDADDVVEGASSLRAITRDMEARHIEVAFLNYDYAHDGQGKPICKLLRERILRRDPEVKWSQPIHEVVGPIKTAFNYKEANIVHHREKYPRAASLVAHRNLKVLLKWLREQTDLDTCDARMLFYLATEEKYVWPDRALEHFRQYTKISGWDEERALAHVTAGKMHEQRGRYDEAFAEYCQASVDYLPSPDGLLGAARCAYHKRRWPKCTEFTERAFEIMQRFGEQPSVLMHDPLERHYHAYVFYSVALINLGRFEEAVAACDKGLKVNPNDPHLIPNRETAIRMLKEGATMMPPAEGVRIDTRESLDAKPASIPNEVLAAIAIQIWKRNMEAGLYVDAVNLLAALPPILRGHPTVLEAKALAEQKLLALKPDAARAEVGAGAVEEIRQVGRAPEAAQKALAPVTKPFETQDGRKLKIAIYTGPAWETWGPDAIRTGIGGSETAAIHMSKELTALGHQVTVIGDCQGLEGLHDGVDYLDHRHVHEGRVKLDGLDVLVASRAPWAFDLPIEAKAKYLWIHDVHVGPPSEGLSRQLAKADKIFCLSNAHKELVLRTYPDLPATKIYVTRNGIDTSRFAEPLPKTNRLVWSSSPDRGLDRLLELWPSIRAEVPDAELHIYYGFDNWEKMAKVSKLPVEEERIQRFKNLIKAMSALGVHNHGRVGQKELAEAFLRSKVWPYSTFFFETSCVSAMEAQAAGCIPVTSSVGALPETVKHGHVISPLMPSTSREYGDEFVKMVVRLLKDTNDLFTPLSRSAREYALANLSWTGVAQDWTRLFANQLGVASELREHTREAFPAAEPARPAVTPNAKIVLPAFEE